MTGLFDVPQYEEVVESDDWTAAKVTPKRDTLSQVSGQVPTDALDREWVPIVTQRNDILFRESEIAGFVHQSP